MTEQGSRTAEIRHYLATLLLVAISTLIGLAIAPRWGTSAVDLLFLPAVLGAAVIGGFGPALIAATCSALAYNFFFTAPHFTFRITEANDLLTVIVLLAVALVTSQLTASIRKQAARANAHADRNATVAGFARRLLSCTRESEIFAVTAEEVARVFTCNVQLLAGTEAPVIVASAPGTFDFTPNDWAAAGLAIKAGEPTGRGVDRAVPTEWQFRPLRSGERVLGALALARDDGSNPATDAQAALLDNLLDQVALALDRTRLETDSREFARLRERDQLRSALLATVGQDMQPALAALGKTVRDLRREGVADRSLIAELTAETASLERHVANLSDLGSDDDRAPVTAGDLTIDLFRREVRRAGEPAHLTPKEYAVLAELAKQPGRVLSHAHLLRTVWGPAQEGNSDYLRVAVRSLRQKLEADPKHPRLILNEPAVGYRLNA